MSDDVLKADVYAAVSAVLHDASLWNGTPFAVYRDFDMENMVVEPARPFVFIGSRNTAVIPKFLPYVMLDIEIDRIVLQMGSVSSQVRVSINIVGRTEGEASRISSVLKRNVVTFGTGYSAQIDTDRAGVSWLEEAVAIPEPYWSEGTLRQVLSIRATFLVM